MGLFDGRSASYSEVRRKASPTRTASGTSKGYFVRPHVSSSSSRSSNSFFNFGGGSRGFGFGSGSSSYRRSPRAGYIKYLWARLQRMVRELWAYARRHPMKAFFAVVVPLLSAGGAIHGLMKQFGVQVPGMDLGGARTMRGGYYGSAGYGGGGGGWMDNAGSLLQVAKAFM
ncbi:hypothetical protein BDY17DRAFT_180221 [Neohortaea acidophila]|uniref:Uncharacterized protein n=1 Tax=Neohortaea acidophila TaxID=245834 RepID=A0A6A6PLW7_9PEZI|nr:uncharacterized protein BDY17DRAFT_180221 [Neohortaea acidophila]KAF2480982.1 hypothetical protein BDY17DRAFT_180221 [Neohortaea acidophila]